MAHSIKTVGVVGTGVIGASWTGLFLANGLKVLVSDPAPGAEEKLQSYLKSIWPTLEDLGLASGASLSNCTFVGASLDGHFQELDFVQENAPEKLELKTKLLGQIDAGTRPDVIIASSSSGIVSSQFITQCKKNPGRVLIGHPFNPPHLMPLVEVVPHPNTDAKITEQAIEFYKSLGKTPVHIKQEIPGFAANRLQAALCNEAYSLVSRGIMSAEDVDACMTSSLGPRWALVGPLMSVAMGGGGGMEGFEHMMQHLGPAVQSWLADIDAHAFNWSDESMTKLKHSVRDDFGGKDVKELEKKRDERMVKLLKLKSE